MVFIAILCGKAENRLACNKGSLITLCAFLVTIYVISKNMEVLI